MPIPVFSNMEELPIIMSIITERYLMQQWNDSNDQDEVLVPDGGISLDEVNPVLGIVLEDESGERGYSLAR